MSGAPAKGDNKSLRVIDCQIGFIRMKYNSEYQYILMLLESVKPRVYGWTLK